MKKRICKAPVIVVLAALAIGATPSESDAAVKNFMVVINGAQETPPNPSLGVGNGS